MTVKSGGAAFMVCPWCHASHSVAEHPELVVDGLKVDVDCGCGASFQAWLERDQRYHTRLTCQPDGREDDIE